MKRSYDKWRARWEARGWAVTRLHASSYYLDPTDFYGSQAMVTRGGAVCFAPLPPQFGLLAEMFGMRALPVKEIATGERLLVDVWVRWRVAVQPDDGEKISCEAVAVGTATDGRKAFWWGVVRHHGRYSCRMFPVRERAWLDSHTVTSGSAPAAMVWLWHTPAPSEPTPYGLGATVFPTVGELAARCKSFASILAERAVV